MRTIDSLASSQYQIPSLILMENAGIKVAEAVKSRLHGRVQGARVLVLAGKGNNGGDGLVAARHLYNQGAEVTIVLLAQEAEVAGDARINLEIVKKLPIKVIQVKDEKDLHPVRVALLSTEVIVDAIYGTGFKGKPPALVSRLVRLVNNSQRLVVAVDIPSGVEADTGKVEGEAIKAHCTVTMALPKLGLVLLPGARYTGELIVADISIPQALVDTYRTSGVLLSWQWCARRLPLRDIEGHKGDYGHVLVLGGSPGLTGAVVLTGEAALRSGAGLVTVGVARSLNPILEEKLTEVMTRPLPETAGGFLSPEAAEALSDLWPRVTAVAVGPGLSIYPEAKDFLRAVLRKTTVPVVIDADGLNIVASEIELLKEAQAPVILTPHPGEMARLLNISVAEVQSQRLEVARSSALRWGAIVVLKGARTIIATPAEEVFVNPTGNPGMASGGTGDVLTGIIAGLLAQGLRPAIAAAMGVFIHGAAGDKAAEEKGLRSMTAVDVIASLPFVFKRLEESAGERLAGIEW